MGEAIKTRVSIRVGREVGHGASFPEFQGPRFQRRVSTKREFPIPLEDRGKLTVPSVRLVLSASITVFRSVGEISGKRAICKEGRCSPGLLPASPDRIHFREKSTEMR